MSEPPRLHKTSDSSLERELLKVGRSYRGSPRTREKVLAGMGLAGSAAIGLGGAQAASSAVLTNVAQGAGSLGRAALGKVTLTKFVAAISLVGAVAAIPGAYWLSKSRSGDGAKRESAAEQMATETADEAALVSPGLNPLASETRGRNGSSHANLTRELRMLDEARAALAAGNGSNAIAKLDAYAKAFPNGGLTLESEVLRIDALTRSGQRALARKRAEAFLARHPSSVLAPRVRGVLSSR